MRAVAFYDTAGSVKQLVALRRPACSGDCQRGGGQSTTAPRSWRAKLKTIRRTIRAFSWCAAAVKRRPIPQANKMSVAFSLENRTGSLVAALSALSAMGTNLTKIESRPVQGKPWEYIFYVDCQIGSSEEGRARSRRSRAHCGMVKELGRYREARAWRTQLPDRGSGLGSRGQKKGIGCGWSICFLICANRVRKAPRRSCSVPKVPCKLQASSKQVLRFSLAKDAPTWLRMPGHF